MRAFLVEVSMWKGHSRYFEKIFYDGWRGDAPLLATCGDGKKHFFSIKE
jgi:hypothetical protein